MTRPIEEDTDTGLRVNEMSEFIKLGTNVAASSNQRRSHKRNVARPSWARQVLPILCYGHVGLVLSSPVKANHKAGSHPAVAPR